MNADKPVRHERLLLALVVSVGAALRFREALRTPLWFDELYSLSAVQRSFGDMLEVMRRDVHPPLHFVLSWLWLRAGASDLWVRELSIAMGLLGIVVVWALARSLAGPRAGLVAAALVALHPWHIYISQEARSYALLWLLLGAAALAAWRILERPMNMRIATYALAAAAALWTHYLAGVVLLVLGLWGLASAGRDGARLRAWLTGNAIAVALFAPVVPVLMRQLGRARADHWVAPPSAMDLVDVGQRIASSSPLIAVAVAALAVAPLVRTGRRREAMLVWTVGAGGLLACWLLGLAGFRMFAVKYVMFALPFAMIAIALGLESIRPAWPRALASAAMLLLLARAAWLRPPQAEATAFGIVARELEGRVQPGDVVFHGDTHALFWGRHYLPRATHVLLLMDRALPYFEGAALVPESWQVGADSLERTAARGDRWWALTVHKVGLDARLAASRFDALAAAPADTVGLVRLWWSGASGGPRVLGGWREGNAPR